MRLRKPEEYTDRGGRRAATICGRVTPSLLNVYYIAFFVPEAPGGSSIAGPHYLIYSD
jgi:hypothetical protein